MSEFLRWLAGFGGKEIPQGDGFRFEFLAMPEGTAGLLALAGLVGVLFGIYMIYRRDAARLSFGKRTTLAALRLAALLVVVVVVLEPNLVHVRKTVKPGDVLLLLDTSQSMGHRDSYVRSEEWADSWRAVGVAEPSKASRLELVKSLLQKKGMIDAMAKKNRLRVLEFGASSTNAPVVTAPKAVTPGGKKGEEEKKSDKSALPPAPKLDFEKILPTGGSSNFTASIRQALEGSRDARIASLILITDGRRNAGGSLEEVGRFLKRRRVESVLVVPVGDPAEAWTVGVREITAAERIFKGDPLKVSAILTSQGYGEQELEVKLEEVDKDGKTLKVLANKGLRLGGELASNQIDFDEVKLEKVGEHALRVSVIPPSGEDFDVDKHTLLHKVEVLSESLKVLLVAGSPSHEYRTLRTQLIRDKTIDVACFLLSADLDFPQEGNTKIKELPTTPKDLDRFDVVIFVDVLQDPDRILIPRDFITNLVKGVTDRGVGLWWVMGEKSSAKAGEPGSPLLPLIQLMPVVPDFADPQRELGYGGYFRVEYKHTLTKAGQEHRICRVTPDPTRNALLWSKMPGFYWSFPVLRAKPAAQVLAVHPGEKYVTSEGPRPLMAVQFVGAGRVLYTGTDEMYRWLAIDRELYNSFWVKGIRYLYEGRLAGGSSRFQLGLSLEQVTLGKEIEIYLRARTEQLEPLIADSVPVQIKGPGGHSEELLLDAVPSTPGRFAKSFRPSSLGTWQIVVGNQDGDNSSLPVQFAVLRSELESQGPSNLAGLSQLTDAAAGKLLRPDKLSAHTKMIPSRSTTEVFLRPYPLWDKWITLCLVLFFLTLEWVLRKRFDLI